MRRMLFNRTLFGLFTVWVVSVIVFAATQALPGDAARAVLGRQATPERLAALRDQLNLDQPLLAQYFSWLGGILRFDLGTSLAGGEPVGSILWPALANSAILMLAATVIATPLAIGLGAWSAMRRDRPFDHVTGVVVLVLAAMPEFVVGIVLVLIFATGVLQVFPAVFVLAPGEHVLAHPEKLALPTLTLILAVSPYIIRIMRATMLEVLDSDYVQQARLKGLRERVVIVRHAVPNAIGPVAQVIALQLAWLLGGVVLVEFLFRYPGIGFQLVDAVSNRDLPLVQGIVMAIAIFYVLVNLLADVVTLLANPKVRTAE